MFHDHPKEREALVAEGFDEDLDAMEREAAKAEAEIEIDPNDLETIAEGFE